MQPGHAWIIGGTGGLGEAAATELAVQGWDITVSGRSAEKLHSTAERLDGVGAGQLRSMPLDVTDDAAVSTALAEFKTLESVPDAVIVSGGGPPPSSVSDLSISALDDAYRLLLRPVARIVRELGVAMAERGSGTIVAVTSSGAKEPIPGLATSNIFRAGVTALIKSAAEEMAEHGVRLVCVAPGRIATDRVAGLDRAAAKRQGASVADVEARSKVTIPARRYGEPEEFGAVVAFLCSPQASYINGVTISVDGAKGRGLLS